MWAGIIGRVRIHSLVGKTGKGFVCIYIYVLTSEIQDGVCQYIWSPRYQTMGGVICKENYLLNVTLVQSINSVLFYRIVF